MITPAGWRMLLQTSWNSRLMRSFFVMSKWSLLRVASVLLFNVLLTLCNCGCFLWEHNHVTVLATLAQVSEAQLLLEFRSVVIDDGNALVDWRETSNGTVCGWTGVMCNSAGSVTGINLSRKKLMGSHLHLPLCHLSSLTSLQLQDNLFSGQLPAGIEQCTNLEHLNLGANNFTGPISESIFALQSLQYLNLSLNMFTAGLPSAFGRLQKLQVLDVVASGVNGSLPVELGNLVEMKNLSLSWNSFSPGGLPRAFANLEQLIYFECAGCNLNGSLPSWLGKLSRLKYLDLSNNDLTGAIPQSLMALQGLKWLELYKNKLTGQIPVEIWNLTSLNDLDVSGNGLTGFIPDGVTKLEHLRVLHLQNNSLTGPIPPRIVDLTKLYDLKLYMNKLTGHVPETLGKNCTLMQFDVSSNELSGPLPSTLCYWGQLWRLILFNNSFTGNLPGAYGNCSSLIRIRISGNGFTGPIPRDIWGLPKLNLLEIHDNKFEGNIFPTIVNAKNLTSLKIYNNRFTGPLPIEIGKLSTLERLHANQNNLSGPIPSEIGHLGSSVTSLYLDENSFSGAIPMEISNLTKLVYLGLSRNKLSGSFPIEVGNLENLIYLDISSNNLSGDLSKALEYVKLQHFVTFNCSFNNFSGKLTDASSFSSASTSSSFIGNPDLCVLGTNNISSSSQTNNTSSCNTGSSKHSKGTMSRTLAISIIGGVLAIAIASATLATLAMWYFCRRRKLTRGLMNEVERLSPWSMTLFHSTTLTYKDVTECLEEENVIGSGGGGKVYKATLKSGQVIAIKKLWGKGKGIDLHDHGFQAEVETLGAIRHRNIVKLLCCCSDFTSNLLVYEYMPKGSLGDHLHDLQNATLHWEMRYKIAIGAAQGLSYLHHDCVPQIIHRDIKSNNILLDEAYEAHVADFGLAKSLDDVTMSAVAGSYGYIAPEYAYTLKVNEKSDVYSFGVVLMELVTGRCPVEPEFGDGDIVRWASSKLQKGDDLVEIFDPRVGAQHHSNMAKMFKVATACTQPLPRMRPTMREVVDRLMDISPPQTYKQASLPQKANLQGSGSTVEFVYKEETDG